MSLCDTCRAPGACCSGFVLSQHFERSRWKQAARKLMKSRRLPFYPVRMLSADDSTPDVSVQFDCRWLGDDGRCRHYERRPQTCRTYEAGQDALCAEYIQTLSGIPIIYVSARA